MTDPDLRQHLARVTACLAEAVDHVTATDPGGDHDAGLWAAAVAEAAAALAGQPGPQPRNTRAPRGTSAALLLAAPELARALGLLRDLLTLYEGQRLAPPETFAAYWQDVRDLLTEAEGGGSDG